MSRQSPMSQTLSTMLLDPAATQRVWAGDWSVFSHKKPIRKWTVPIGDCVARPTEDFYIRRWVLLSNEGNRVHPNWVALDRYNDPNWNTHRYSQVPGTLLLKREF